MRNWPLRLKVTIWVSFVGTIALTLFGGVILADLQRKTIASIDDSLRVQAVDFFQSLSDRRVPVEWTNEIQVREVFSPVRSLFAIEIEKPPGTKVYRSRNLGGASIPSAPDNSPITATVGDKQARVLQVRQGDTILRIAADLGPARQTNRSMLVSYAVMLPITILIMAFGGFWLSGKALKPVNDIAATAERVTAQRLDERLPPTGIDDEIGRLTNVLNAMMDLIRDGFTQARRFTADASHELKTPLTILRGEIEASLRSSDLSPAIEKTMLNLHEETGRLIYLVEGLLLLSQAEVGQLNLSRQRVDLSQLANEIIEDAEILAAPQGITLETHIAPQITVDGDRQFLRQILLNLCDNAVKYNLPGGNVTCALTESNGLVTFTISNTGQGIAQGEGDHIFLRFNRGDKSRDRRTGGQGLGLSISREIARAHGGDITLAPSAPRITTFKFTLPSATNGSEPGRLPHT